MEAKLLLVGWEVAFLFMILIMLIWEIKLKLFMINKRKVKKVYHASLIPKKMLFYLVRVVIELGTL